MKHMPNSPGAPHFGAVRITHWCPGSEIRRWISGMSAVCFQGPAGHWIDGAVMVIMIGFSWSIHESLGPLRFLHFLDKVPPVPHGRPAMRACRSRTTVETPRSS
jgi:hypothetical protein